MLCSISLIEPRIYPVLQAITCDRFIVKTFLLGVNVSIKFIHDDAMGLQQNCAQNLSKIIEVSPRIIGSWKLVVRGSPFCCVQQQLRDANWNFECDREQRSLARYPRKRFIRAGERSGYVQVTLFEQKV